MKYRLVGRHAGDIDLTRHVRTPAGVAYFHKPIGSPIGGGSGARTALKVTTTTPDWQNLPFSSGKVGPTNAEKVKNAATMYGTGSKQHLKAIERFKIPGQEAHDSAVQRFAPKTPATAAKPKTSVADDVLAEHYASVQRDLAKHFKANPTSAKDKAALSKALALDPKFAGKIVRQVRAQATSKTATKDERAAAKAELQARVKAAKAIHAQKKSFISALTTKIDEAPADADLAPIIGETLAAHPSFGPLAHVWDRLRLAKYNFKKASTADVVKDKAGDVAQRIFTVIIAGILLHLGAPMVPGLVGG